MGRRSRRAENGMEGDVRERRRERSVKCPPGERKEDEGEGERGRVYEQNSWLGI